MAPPDRIYTFKPGEKLGDVPEQERQRAYNQALIDLTNAGVEVPTDWYNRNSSGSLYLQTLMNQYDIETVIRVADNFGVEGINNLAAGRAPSQSADTQTTTKSSTPSAEEQAAINELGAGGSPVPVRFGTTATGGTEASDPEAEFVAALLEAGYVPVPGQDGVFFNPITNDTFDANQAGGSGDGTGNALGYAQLAESQRQFDASFAEGRRQFDQQFGLDAQRFGLDKQEYAARRDEFAQNFAENQRQFNEQQNLAQSRFGLEQQQFQSQRELGLAAQRLNEQRFGLEKQQVESQQRLQQAQFKRDVLRSPSDYIFAAFESRGATPPREQITHADLINSLQENPYQAAPNAGGIPGFGDGGSTGGNVVLTGEKGPELVFDNPDGTMDVVPVQQSGKQEQGKFGVPGAADGGTFGDPRAARYYDDPNLNKPGYQTGSLPGGGGYYSDPTTGQSGTTGETTPGGLFTYLKRFGGLDPNAAASAAGFASPDAARIAIEGPGTPRFGPAPVKPLTQQDLIDTAIRFSPPAVSAAVSGRQVPNYQLASDLTLGSYSQLNPDERAALATRYAIEHNRNLESDLYELQRRYGPTYQRQARFG